MHNLTDPDLEPRLQAEDHIQEASQEAILAEVLPEHLGKKVVAVHHSRPSMAEDEAADPPQSAELVAESGCNDVQVVQQHHSCSPPRLARASVADTRPVVAHKLDNRHIRLAAVQDSA
jgi:hypothetical protein